MDNLAGAFDLVWRMFVSPRESFQRIGTMRTSFLLVPLILCILSSLILLSIYYSNVNLGWLLDQMSVGMDERQAAALRGMLGRSSLLAISAFGLVASVLVLSLVYALYFHLVGKVADFPVSFGKWFAMTAWAGLPSLLLLPIGLMAFQLATNAQLMPEGLNPTSLNALLFHIRPGSPWRGLLESISIISVWTLVLMMIAIRAWTSASTIRAAAIVLIPHIVIYAAWAGYILANH